MDSSAMLNRGFIAFPPAPAGAAKKPPHRTIIVTGIARSGTSMVAGALREAGIFFGDVIYDVVHEDAQFVQQLGPGKRATLPNLIRSRNEQHDVWGFKAPNLHHLLPVGDIAKFRAPYMIAIFRDPVAIAVRKRLSEHVDEARALLRASNALTSMIEYCARAGCPTLMLSYEKALQAPEAFVETLIAFCGIECDPEQRHRMLRQIEPNKPSYLEQAKTTYDGVIDGIIGGRLCGWCRRIGWLQPVELDVFANEILLGTTSADRFRVDLADAGIGNGSHGFAFDLNNFPANPDCRISVKVRDTVFDLRNSNKAISGLTKAAA
jgi:hypothetical protein